MKKLLTLLAFSSLMSSVSSAQTLKYAMTNSYAYDAVGRITNVIHGNGFVESYTYDGNGNLTRQKFTMDPKIAWDWEWYKTTNDWAEAKSLKKPESMPEIYLATKNGETPRTFLVGFYRLQMTNGLASNPAVSNEFAARYQRELAKLPPTPK